MVCGISVDGKQLEHVSDFRYLEYALDESDTNGVESCKKGINEWSVADVIRFLVNAMRYNFYVNHVA